MAMTYGQNEVVILPICVCETAEMTTSFCPYDNVKLPK